MWLVILITLLIPSIHPLIVNYYTIIILFRYLPTSAILQKATGWINPCKNFIQYCVNDPLLHQLVGIDLLEVIQDIVAEYVFLYNLVFHLQWEILIS